MKKNDVSKVEIKMSLKSQAVKPKSYEGDKPYIFISYSHRDSKIVWPIIEQLNKDGYRVWYDDGIDPGTEWDQFIADKVCNSGCFLAFMSEAYLESDNCKDEIKFARDKVDKIQLVYLSDCKLPEGMELRLGRIQSLYYHKYVDKKEFFKKLYQSPELSFFKEGTVKPVEQQAIPEKRVAKTKKYKFETVMAVLALLSVVLIMLVAGIKKYRSINVRSKEEAVSVDREYDMAKETDSDIEEKETTDDLQKVSIVEEKSSENVQNQEYIGFWINPVEGFFIWIKDSNDMVSGYMESGDVVAGYIENVDKTDTGYNLHVIEDSFESEINGVVEGSEYTIPFNWMLEETDFINIRNDNPYYLVKVQFNGDYSEIVNKNEEIKKTYFECIGKVKEVASAVGRWNTEDYDEVNNWANSYTIKLDDEGNAICTGYRNMDIGKYEQIGPNKYLLIFNVRSTDEAGDGWSVHNGYTYTVEMTVDGDTASIIVNDTEVITNLTDGIMRRVSDYNDDM